MTTTQLLVFHGITLIHINPHDNRPWLMDHQGTPPDLMVSSHSKEVVRIDRGTLTKVACLEKTHQNVCDLWRIYGCSTQKYLV